MCSFFCSSWNGMFWMFLLGQEIWAFVFYIVDTVLKPFRKIQSREYSHSLLCLIVLYYGTNKTSLLSRYGMPHLPAREQQSGGLQGRRRQIKEESREHCPLWPMRTLKHIAYVMWEWDTRYRYLLQCHGEDNKHGQRLLLQTCVCYLV